jgi:hypothetical protein
MNTPLQTTPFRRSIVFIAGSIALLTLGNVSLSSALTEGLHERVVKIENSQLVVDQKNQPQLFGAEVQYFRLRGGYGPNVPRSEVLALWAKALDRVVEAKMNAVSFYIPWDFHEYAEGKFDFDGTVDADGDGKPDYPSRDLKTFFKMVQERGITRIMVRPGPYINAEWGNLGFGAVPDWFHEKYPDSHMLTSWGWRSKLFDYANPDFLRHTALWFSALYQQVLRDKIGPGRPVVFLQLDNETNYQWQSLFLHDYSPRAVARYQNFLQATYGSLERVNAMHHRAWLSWSNIQPPVRANENIQEDQDWYRFADQTIYSYLAQIRKIWEGLGVREPQVLFTLAESYNAAGNGLLPNPVLRNAAGVTGLMTVNLYPKTFETLDHALLNNPFKTDLDVKSADEANDSYLGSRQEWVMGPEIQGGWWRGIEIKPQARQQTYLTVLGHGMKSLFVYYFNEGQNWKAEWAVQKIQPLYEKLRQEWNLSNTPPAELSNEFWGELQARSDRLILVGFDVRRLMQLSADDIRHDQTLYFDSPLDENANPREHFTNLKLIGAQVVSPFADFLGRSREVYDNVALVKDSASHVPSPVPGIDALAAATDWAGGLLGLLMNAGVNPHVLHGELSQASTFAAQRVLAHIDTGINHPRTIDMLRRSLAQGNSVFNFLDDHAALELGSPAQSALRLAVGAAKSGGKLVFFTSPDGSLRTGREPDAQAHQLTAPAPVFTYHLENIQSGDCQPILFIEGTSDVVGYRCHVGGGFLTQIGALISNDFNSSAYAQMTDFAERQLFMTALLGAAKISPLLKMTGLPARTVAFARKDPLRKLLWITVKTGTLVPQEFRIQPTLSLLQQTLLAPGPGRGSVRGATYRVTDLLAQKSRTYSSDEISKSGFEAQLAAEGSTVYTVEALAF